MKGLVHMTKTNKTIITVSLLSLIAGGVLGGAGVYFLQPEHDAEGMLQQAENPELLQVCEELAGGNTQALLDVMAIHMDEYYLVHGIEQSDGESTAETYHGRLKDGMDEAYEYYFAGKDIEVCAINMEEVIIPSFSGTETTYAPTYMYEFYENDSLLLTMTFSQVTDGKYEITEEYEWEADIPTDIMPAFTSAVIPMNGFYPEFYNAVRQKTIHKEDGEGFAPAGIGGSAENYRDKFTEKLSPLRADGWQIVDETMRHDRFDTDVNRWTYLVCFEVENTETGASCILQQQFAYSSEFLYPCENMKPVIICESGDVPESVKEVLLNLF